MLAELYSRAGPALPSSPAITAHISHNTALQPIISAFSSKFPIGQGAGIVIVPDLSLLEQTNSNSNYKTIAQFKKPAILLYYCTDLSAVRFLTNNFISAGRAAA